MISAAWRRSALLGSVAFAASVATFIAVCARAAGIPDAAALTYTGYLEDPDGNPVTTTKGIGLALYADETGGKEVCGVRPADIEPVSGRFQIVLPDDCTAAVSANPKLWVEVEVEGSLLGRTKLGAVPYAVEAGHATVADTATAADGKLKTTLDVMQAQLAGLTTGCAGKKALQSVSADGTPVCAPANDIVAITATVTGATGGNATKTCPSGYTLVAAAEIVDQRTASSPVVGGWDNGGVWSCTISANTLTASLGQYAGTSQTSMSCQGICVR